jgi:hypothetical protein
VCGHRLRRISPPSGPPAPRLIADRRLEVG